MKQNMITFYAGLAKALAAQFGPECEIVIHDLEAEDIEHSIVAIENGHVSGRRTGDGPSHIVLEALKSNGRVLEDRLAYLTRTRDGKILKSSTVYIRDDTDKVVGILGINYDITLLLAMENHLKAFTGTNVSGDSTQQAISVNVSDLLDDLIEQSTRLVGKPASIMTREDKINVIRFLNEAGAFLITKSGPKICQFLGISKFTLYNYLDEIRSSDEKS